MKKRLTFGRKVVILEYTNREAHNVDNRELSLVR